MQGIACEVAVVEICMGHAYEGSQTVYLTPYTADICSTG